MGVGATIKDDGMNQWSFFDGENPLRITKPLRLIELFAGIGAQAKALENLKVKFEHYRVCEINKEAIKSYNAIHGTNFISSDITRMRGDDLGIVNTDKFDYVLTYSYPCTDISTAGKRKGMRKGSGTRSGLLWEVERLLRETKELPQILLMENVPGVLHEKNSPDFFEWCRFLEQLGYTNKFKMLNAKDYGIPQNRERCFMLSWLGENYYYDFPEKTAKMKPFVDYLDFDEKYIINPNKLTATQKRCIRQISNEWISKTIRTSGLKSRDRHEWSVYSVELRQSESFIKNKSLWIKDISKTICVQHLNSYTIDGKVYFDYSPKECWRLMGFDDESFSRAENVVSNSQLYKQAGNSIVVDVLMAIFKNLF